MISLPNMNSNIAIDTDIDSHIEKGDIVVPFTLAEHELMNDIIMNAVNAADFAIPYCLSDLPFETRSFNAILCLTIFGNGLFICGLIVSNLLLINHV